MLFLINVLLGGVNNIRNEKLSKKFGKRVKALREEKGFSQESLAIEANISISQVARIEKGEINSTISTLDALASAFKMTVGELLTF